METPLITAAALAEAVSCHPSTIRRLANEGHLPCYWVGSSPRFDEAEAHAAMRLGPKRKQRPVQGDTTPRIHTLDIAAMRTRLYG